MIIFDHLKKKINNRLKKKKDLTKVQIAALHPLRRMQGGQEPHQIKFAELDFSVQQEAIKTSTLTR